jgi:hypothetical protein
LSYSYLLAGTRNGGEKAERDAGGQGLIIYWRAESEIKEKIGMGSMGREPREQSWVQGRFG